MARPDNQVGFRQSLAKTDTPFPFIADGGKGSLKFARWSRIFVHGLRRPWQHTD